MIEYIVSNRIIASGILVLVFILACLICSVLFDKARKSLGDVLRSLLNMKILTPFILYSVYAILVVSVLFSFQIVDITNIVESILVIVSWAGFMFFESYKTKSFSEFGRRVLTSTIGFMVFLTAYLNLASFSVWIEVLLQLFILALTIIQVFAKHYSYRSVENAMNVLLAIIFVVMFINSTVMAFNDPERLLLSLYSVLVSLVISILLALFILPFAIYCQLESLMLRLKLLYKNNPYKLKTRIAVLLGLHFNLKYISNFNGLWQTDINRSSFRGTIEYMKKYRKEIRALYQNEKARISKLEELAGIEGRDSQGLVIDRRGFDEIKKQLKKVQDFQNDRILIWKADYSQDSLAACDLENEEIGLTISSDCSKYYAWKIAPGGWAFGVGGTGRTNERWRFDGSSKPDSFPDEGDSRWRNIMVVEESPEWISDDGIIIG